MITFKGHLTGETEKYFYKKNNKNSLLILLGTVLLSIPLLLRLSMHFHSRIILICYFLMWVFWLLMILVPRKEEKLRKIQPTTIVVDKSGIEISSEEKTFNVDLKNVSAVYVNKDFYEIKYGGDVAFIPCICQKDLISEGSIEAFEELFKEKIKNSH